MQPGTCLGDRYVVVELVGTGEHGSVWFGSDTVMDRPVRIKSLDPELARDDSVRARFRRTSLAVASLDIPGIGEVYDCVEERDGDDITLCQIGERFDGEPLRHKLLTGRTFADEDALALVGRLARSLHAAHQRGLVHLNLKSANVLVSPGSELRIVDFGFQQTGDAADDVHALGAIAYECLSGAKPFAVEPDAPPGEQERQPQPLPSTVAPAVARFVKRALSRRPDERFTTAARLATECEQISYTHDVLGALLERRQPEPEPEPGAGLGSLLEAALGPPEPAGSVAGGDTVADEPGPAPKPESEPESEPGSEAAYANEPVPVPVPVDEPGPQSEPESASEPETEPEPATDLRPAAIGAAAATAAEPEPAVEPAPRRRRRLTLVAMLALLLAFAGTAVAVTLFPDGTASTTDDGSGQGVAEPQDTSPITTGAPPSRGGNESGNDPAESGSSSKSSGSPTDSDSGDGNDEPQKATVPNVIGDDARNAYDELRGAGFEVVVDKSGKGDHACPVHDQNPDSGTSLDKGSTVVMSVRMVRNSRHCDGGGGDDDDNDD